MSLCLVASEPDTIKALTPMQRYAIMQMRESQVSRTVCKRLAEMLGGLPSLDDYVALRGMGLAERRTRDRWHRLTFDGMSVALELERMFCLDLNVHLLMWVGDHAGGTTAFRCPCGWSTSVRRSENGAASARFHFRRHTTEAGQATAFMATAEHAS